MKQYIEDKENLSKKKKKKKKKGDQKEKSSVTKKDFGLTENAKVILENA